MLWLRLYGLILLGSPKLGGFVQALPMEDTLKILATIAVFISKIKIKININSAIRHITFLPFFFIIASTNFASTSQPVHTRQQCSYMGAWASQATVPFIQHICRYVQISSNIYKRKNRSTKAGHENPKKPAGGKNTGNVYPRPRQWCNPWGFRVC